MRLLPGPRAPPTMLHTVQHMYAAFLPLCLVVVAFAASPGAPPFASPAVCRDAADIPLTATTAINRHLSALVNASTFFSVFEVALERSCPFWDDDAMCVIRDCTVHNCTDAEVPSAWRASCDAPADGPLNDVDRSRTGLAALVAHPWWLTSDSAAWTVRDAHDQSVFVDLRRNPERYTGYAAPGSTRIWQAIYDENCFAFSSKCRSGICAPDTCKEERVLYRLISGIHTSITMHIAKEYLISEGNWGVNTQIYKSRVRPFPERIANLQVAYALVLRAVGKASQVLHPANYSYLTGDKSNDDETHRRLEVLFDFPQLQQQCQRRAFDESDMFLHEHHALLPQFRRAFRNISMIMDCVGCEKCRLWGKLQFLGVATALRILFEPQIPEFERNEVIALINLLHKLSSSVLWVDKMEQIIQREDEMLYARILVSVMAVMFAVLAWSMLRSKKPRRGEDASSSEEVEETEHLLPAAKSSGRASRVPSSGNGGVGPSQPVRRRKRATAS